MICFTLAGGMTIACSVFHELDVQVRQCFQLGLIARNDVSVRIVWFAKQALMPGNGAVGILFSFVNTFIKDFSYTV